MATVKAAAAKSCMHHCYECAYVLCIASDKSTGDKLQNLKDDSHAQQLEYVSLHLFIFALYAGFHIISCLGLYHVVHEVGGRHAVSSFQGLVERVYLNDLSRNHLSTNHPSSISSNSIPPNFNVNLTAHVTGCNLIAYMSIIQSVSESHVLMIQKPSI